MIERHWEGVINAATTDVTNARAEAIDGRIHWVKRMACGYRNRANFRNAIYFQLGRTRSLPGSPEISPLESLKRPNLIRESAPATP